MKNNTIGNEDVRINGANISDFVLSQKTAKVNEEETVDMVAKEIVKLIDEIFINYSNSR